ERVVQAAKDRGFEFSEGTRLVRMSEESIDKCLAQFNALGLVFPRFGQSIGGHELRNRHCMELKKYYDKHPSPEILLDQPMTLSSLACLDYVVNFMRQSHTGSAPEDNGRRNHLRTPQNQLKRLPSSPRSSTMLPRLGNANEVRPKP